jgi:hypothetical protein
MSAAPSELVAIARLNSNFQKNYGRFIGAELYLRSMSAASGRFPFGAASCLRLCRPLRAGCGDIFIFLNVPDERSYQPILGRAARSSRRRDLAGTFIRR